MSPRVRQWLEDLCSPLALAAYGAWAVVWIGSADDLAGLGPVGSVLSRLALVGFLVGFAACVTDVMRHRPLVYRVTCLALAAGALGLIAVSRSGVTPILLVLLVAALAACLQDRELLLWFIAVNVAFIAIVAFGWRLERDGLWITVVAQVSFQAFAALLMRTARRAEDIATELRTANAELLTTRTLLAEGARDQERLRLSRELHDVAGHGLTALKLNLELLARDPRQPEPRRIATSLAVADELLKDLRRVVQQTRQGPGLDLRAALQRLSVPLPRPRLRLLLPEGASLANRDQFEAVLRAVQEALTNAARHGHARELQVELRADGTDWVLSLEDDGRAPERLRPGGGLSGMRERFEQLGGSLRDGRGDRGGMRLEARWPRVVAP